MAFMRLTREHRGLRHYVWTWRHTVEIVCLWALLTWGAVESAPWIAQAWVALLQWAWPQLGLGTASDLAMHHTVQMGLPWLRFEVKMSSHLPTRIQWWTITVSALLAMLVTFRMSRERLPLIYIIRVVALLLLCSALAFEFFTAEINSDPSRLVVDVMALGLYLLVCFPTVHALVLHIFPMRWWLKCAATVSAVAFIAISIPFQAGSLALIAQHTSSLSIAPLYMLGTFLPQLMVQLAIYGYFMSLTVPIPESRASKP